MTEAEILELSKSSHTPGARVSLGEAWLMLRRCTQLTERNPLQFIGPGYQEDICDQ
jgi:hypothetical protein